MKILISPPTYGFGLSTLFEPAAAALPGMGIRWELAPAVGHVPEGQFDLACLYCLPDSIAAFLNLLAAQRAGLPIVAMAVYWNPTRYYTEGLAYAELPGARAAAAQEQELRQARLQVELALLRVIYRACAVVIAQSPTEADALAKDFGIDPERIVVAWVGNGKAYAEATPEAFRRKYITPHFGEREFALCVGRADPNKNQLALIRALRDENIPLVLAGGSLAPAYLDECQRNANSNVLFLPALSDAELVSAYAAARVHVLASWLEVVGFVTLEAGVAGCNVVLTREHGGRDYVGELGWYCDPGDLDSIQRAVVAAYRAPRQSRLREHLLQTFSWEKHTHALRAAFERALALPPVPDGKEAYADMQGAVESLLTLIPQLETSHAELWRAKSEAEKRVQALASGRVMRLLSRLHFLQSNRE